MLHKEIKDKIIEAMKAKESVRLEVLRGVLAAFTNELIATGKTPQDTIDDEAALVVIKRLAKQRKDSIEQFEKGNRQDLANKERAELVHLEEFLPENMPIEEIKKIAEAKKAELGIEDKTKMGMLMGAVMKELKGEADGGDVKKVVESLF
jgi:uncharacterized protein YqeY